MQLTQISPSIEYAPYVDESRAHSNSRSSVELRLSARICVYSYEKSQQRCLHFTVGRYTPMPVLCPALQFNLPASQLLVAGLKYRTVGQGYRSHRSMMLTCGIGMIKLRGQLCSLHSTIILTLQSIVNLIIFVFFLFGFRREIG